MKHTFPSSSVPFTSLVIVGGGTAGWMAASLFSRHFPHLRIELIESDKIPPIGVGEGSTPYLKHFFRDLGITEQEWMPECMATYKCGIRFPGWLNKEDTGYFHPFYSPYDKRFGEEYFDLIDRSRAGLTGPSRPDNFFFSGILSDQKKCPKHQSDKEFQMDYGYHFDSAALGQFLRRWAEKKGVHRVVSTVNRIVHQNSEISGLILECGQEVKADLYIDCTGFQSLLMEKALGSNFRSYESSLLNDSAVAIATPRDEGRPIPCETVSTGLSSGWAWQIPLVNRYGNGYVYSSEYQSAESAERELVDFLGVNTADAPIRHLSMRVGRLDEHWKGNCIAVGLSQGFLEPLEATALMLVQITIDKSIRLLKACDLDLNRSIAGFNSELNALFDGVKDYIQCHYKLNKREDSDYWVANRESTPISGELDSLLASWQQGESVSKRLDELYFPSVYQHPSWYCIFAGMDNLPLVTDHCPELERSAKLHYSGVAQEFCDHRDYLVNLYGDKWPKIDIETF